MWESLWKMLMNKVEIELKCYQNWLNILTSNIHFSLLWLLSSQQHQKYSFNTYEKKHNHILSMLQGQKKIASVKNIADGKSFEQQAFLKSLSFDTQHKLPRSFE